MTLTSAPCPKRRETLAWLAGLLRSTADRAPFFGCFGLHEWAMVYRQTPEEIRHAVLLATTTLGFPTMMKTLSWVEDIIGEK